MTRSLRLGAGALAFAFIALHLPFLPASLEDLDSINFALGIREFDVTRHQPHPPGYPVFMLAAKAVHAMVPSEAHVLAILGILTGGLAAFALVALFRALEGNDASGYRPLMAALLTLTSPLFFMTAARPLSDVTGLSVTVAVQAFTLAARTPGALIAASFLSALAAGIRSQVVWLTVPLLAFATARHVFTAEDAEDDSPLRPLRPLRFKSGWRVVGLVFLTYVAGALVWFVPLLLITGPAAYFQTVFNQGAEDFLSVNLWTTPTPRLLLQALRVAFVAPWSFVPTAVIVLALAAAGFVEMLRRGRPALVALLVAFGPYFVFDLLFQETVTTRYALPLVMPVAYAAVRGASLFPSKAVMPAIVVLAGFNAFVSTNALWAYSRTGAPAFRMLRDMRESASPGKSRGAPVLAMHRRDDLDLRRPILWVGDQMPALDRRLSAPGKHEWLEVVKYWNAGGRQPVWFVADPPRSDLALFRRQRPPAEYRWLFTLPNVLGGARPNELDWYIFEPPDWYLGEGWSITPETAGLAREDGRGPSHGGIQGWIRRPPAAANLVIGGRNLAGSGPPANVRVAIDGRRVDETTVPAGFFLRMLSLPAESLAGASDYAAVIITSDQDELAIEQFDAQPAGRIVFGYGDGWNEQEYNPATGKLWRWTSERATLRVRAEGHAIGLSLNGELEEASTSHIIIRAGDRVVAQQDVGPAFSLAVRIPSELLSGAETAVTIETSAWYIPAERRWRSQDRRHLGLKIYSCQLVPVS